MSLNSSLGYIHLSTLHLFIQKRKTWFGLITLFISSPSKKKKRQVDPTMTHYAGVTLSYESR